MANIVSIYYLIYLIVITPESWAMETIMAICASWRKHLPIASTDMLLHKGNSKNNGGIVGVR
jgi:hypothetical protein